MKVTFFVRLSGTLILASFALTSGMWLASLVASDIFHVANDTKGNGAKADQASGAGGSAARTDLKFDPTIELVRSNAVLRVGSGDWPQYCGLMHRNNVATGQNIPLTWDLATGKNVLWNVEHGGGNKTTPVVANGKVFVGGYNKPAFLARYSQRVDLGCLRAHDASTGEFLWQASHTKLPKGKDGAYRDWPSIGVCSPPSVDGDRLWYVSNRSEVVCLDTEGFRDGENDGSIVDEADHDPNDADFIWRVDLVAEFGVEPHNVSASTVLCVGERCFVITSNGVGADHQVVVNPDAPSFVCLDKNTGRVLWTDNSPKANILAGCWSSPCAFEVNSETQIVMAGGDGWIYSFAPEGDGQGHAKLLWKFDTNPKESLFLPGNHRAERCYVMATPVYYDGLVYIGVGATPEDSGDGQGRLWCIDPNRRGDVSSELAVDTNGQPLSPRRVQAVSKSRGEQAIPNPNSAAVWCYTGSAITLGRKPKFETQMHRTLGNVAIRNDLLFVADFGGIVHCLDTRQATEGKPVVHWTHDLTASSWGTPLIVEDRVYVADGDGAIRVFAVSKTKQLISEVQMDSAIETTPVVANDTLYIDTAHQLIAIKREN